jgi:prepilin-type N-terminal cleavage/methylation domain-containing protein
MTSPFAIRHGKGSGFTLIELLVVISIIAILAGLLLPVISSVVQNAHKTEAKSTEVEIVAAVKSYYTEYGQYPVEAASPAVDATFDNSSAQNTSNGEYGHNFWLFNVLRASNSTSTPAGDTAYQALNSRQIIYFEGKDVKSTSTAASGFIPTNPTPTPKGNTKPNPTLETGDLVDPWGNLYYVRIDSNYTGMVMNPYYAGTSDSGSSINYGEATSDTPPITDYSTVVRLDVVSWSPGVDGVMGTSGSSITPTTTGDDVLSWQ